MKRRGQRRWKRGEEATRRTSSPGVKQQPLDDVLLSLDDCVASRVQGLCFVNIRSASSRQDFVRCPRLTLHHLLDHRVRPGRDLARLQHGRTSRRDRSNEWFHRELPRVVEGRDDERWTSRETSDAGLVGREDETVRSRVEGLGELSEVGDVFGAC